MENKEIVICAAVKTECGKIIRGHRHGDCIRAITDRGLKVAKGSSTNQGFITSTNRFVDRIEAMNIHIDLGGTSAQYPKIPLKRNQPLFSEDLY